MVISYWFDYFFDKNRFAETFKFIGLLIIIFVYYQFKIQRMKLRKNEIITADNKDNTIKNVVKITCPCLRLFNDVLCSTRLNPIACFISIE